MNDIEKRARELLAAELDRQVMPGSADSIRTGLLDGGPSMKVLMAALSVSAGKDGYVDAFHELVEMMGIGAKVRVPSSDEGSPKQVWETEMRPRLKAALSAAPQVPEGWVLVPVEPTEEMIEAYHCVEAVSADSDESADDQWAIESYRAMLAAKPEPQASLADRTGYGITPCAADLRKAWAEGFERGRKA